MRFFKFLILFLFGTSIISQGQDLEHPVKWKFSLEKNDNKEYVIKAEAHLAPGFHIWALDPGGDGSLIPTEIEIDQEEEIRWKSDWKESPEPMRQILEYVEGAIFWHETKVTLTRTFVSDGPMSIDGFVSFQVCNAQSCFPPEEIEFKLQVK